MPRPPKSDLGVVDKYCISLTPEASNELNKFCRLKERNRSWVLDKLVKEFLKEFEKEYEDRLI